MKLMGIVLRSIVWVERIDSQDSPIVVMYEVCR